MPERYARCDAALYVRFGRAHGSLPATLAVIRETEPEAEVSHSEKAAEKSPEERRKSRLAQIAFPVGVVLFVVGVAFRLPFPAKLAVFLCSYLLVGGEVVWRAVKNIIRGEVFDENFLMSVATIGAYLLGKQGVAGKGRAGLARRQSVRGRRRHPVALLHRRPAIGGRSRFRVRRRRRGDRRFSRS